MSKHILFSTDARRKILDGINQLTNAVQVTLGPKGRNVAIEREYGPILITKDGVSVAREIELKDPFENMGARMVREVSAKTADAAGDGTTTATVLARAIYREGLKHMTAGANPIEIKRGIDAAVSKVVEFIIQCGESLRGKDSIAQVATIAANSDSQVGTLIADAMVKAGENGVITVEEARGFDNELEVVEGMQFDRGFISPFFVNRPDKMEAVLDNPMILVCAHKITVLKDLVPALEAVLNTGRGLLVIADDVDGEALAGLVVNKIRGNLPIAAVKAPGFGSRRKEMLGDIAVLTGATLISDEMGTALNSISIEDLGSADKVRLSRDSSTIINGHGEKKEIADRINQIQSELPHTITEYDNEKLRERLGKLSGGVVVIRVGAATETELKEKRDRVDDALHATRAAVQEGIVPGGGLTYLRCQAVLDDIDLEGEQKLGLEIIRRALEEPARIIAENAGHDAAVIINKIKESYCEIGFDAKKEVFVEMKAAGIIDPCKVTRLALQYAASIAGMLLTTEAMVTKAPTNKDDKSGGAQPVSSHVLQNPDNWR